MDYTKSIFKKFEAFKDNFSWKRYYDFAKTLLSKKILDDFLIGDFLAAVKFINKTKTEEQVFRWITACSIINAVIAGFPGKLGVGVYVSWSIEFYMAYEIAKLVGLKIERDNFIKFITASGLTSAAVIWGMKSFISFGMSIFSGTPILPAIAIAEFFSTAFLGMLFYLSFIEIKKYEGSHSLNTFTVMRLCFNASKYTYALTKDVKNLIIKDFPDLVKNSYNKIKDLFVAQTEINSKIRGDIFYASAIVNLLNNNLDFFKGPFGQLWLESWKLYAPQKIGSNATPEDIAKFAQSLDDDVLTKVQQGVAAKFFEVLETKAENADGDKWSAKLEEKQNNPGFDAKFINEDGTKEILVNYKYTKEGKDYIENFIQEHDNKIYVVAPPEIAEKLNNPMVIPANTSYAKVEEVNNENFDNLLHSYSDKYFALGGLKGGLVLLSATLSPFIYSYFKGNINKDQFVAALKKIIPEISVKTLSRISMLVIIGPLYGWYLIAKIVGGISMSNYNDLGKQEKVVENIFEKEISRRDLITLSFLPKIN